MFPFLTGCNLIDYHPYDGKIDGETQINRHNIEQIETSLQGRKEIRFAVISDTQRWYDELEDAVESINKREEIDFMIHCGDLSDFGATKEFEWQRDILKKLKVPYVAIVGNHDCLGTGLDVFQKMFGEENFVFTAGFVRFVCINTNALEYDYSHPVPDFAFIKSESENVPEEVSMTVVAMHAKPFDEQFNNNVADVFQYQLHQLHNIQFCLCGHCHATEVFDLFDDGLLYYEITCGKKRQYYVFTMTEEGYTYEVVDY